MAKPRPHHYFTSSQLEQYRPFKQLMRQWQTRFAPQSFVRVDPITADDRGDVALLTMLQHYFPNSCDADGAYLIKVV